MTLYAGVLDGLAARPLRFVDHTGAEKVSRVKRPRESKMREICTNSIPGTELARHEKALEPYNGRFFFSSLFLV